MARLPNKDEYLPVQRYHTKSVDMSSVDSLWSKALLTWYSKTSSRSRPLKRSPSISNDSISPFSLTGIQP